LSKTPGKLYFLQEQKHRWLHSSVHYFKREFLPPGQWLCRDLGRRRSTSWGHCLWYRIEWGVAL